MTIKDKTAIVGIGTTPFYRRGRAGDRTGLDLMLEATFAGAQRLPA